ncbi:MAG: GNAT family N-acetyltransferase [Bryobacterales bacterium]|nr:GNAT family N-acetyltransferase [Bryobacterales bacterium]
MQADVSSTATGNSVEIRPARDAEFAACRLLLASDHPPLRSDVRFLIAVNPSTGQLAGSVCFVVGPRRLAGIRLRVIRTMRCQGIGSRLLRAALDHAGAKPAYLVAWREPDALDPEPFLDRHGFRRTSRITTVEASLPALAEHYARLCQRLHERGRIPQGVRVVPLREAPREQVIRLVEQRLRDRAEPGLYVEQTIHHPQYDECPVVIGSHGEIAGALLWEVTGPGTGQIPVRVVSQQHQGSWANALLLRHATEQGHERQIERIQFEIPDDNPDTAKLAQRYQAKVVAVQERYERMGTAESQ